ncbi:MAG: ABC transporter substrate-binding protein [Solirubrobacteraceae bacterium]
MFAFALLATPAAWPAQAARAVRQPATKLVRLAFPKYDGTLTPYTFQLGYPLVTLVYDTLLWRDAQGVPRPWLARSVTPSDAGRRLTVTLRPGVRWQDGRSLSADDVAFTFAFVASHYQPRFTPELADVGRVQATGPLTVEIDLKHASLGFEDQPLADMPILPEHLWQDLPPGQDAPAGLPVGSGPYRLVSAQPRGGYVFRANDSYFEGHPRVEQIQVPIISQEQDAYDALQRRRVDMLPLSLPQAAAADLGSTLGIKLATGPSYSGTTLLLNLRRPPFNRLAVRRALTNALDLRRIVGNVGPAVPAEDGYIHPASPWSYGAPLQRFDLRAAQSALAALKLAPITVLAPDNDPARLEAGRQVVLALDRAGASATLRKLSPASLGQAIGEDGSHRDFEAAIESTPPLASYDPDYLTTLFGSDPRSAPLNFGGYRSKAFDALAERVASAPDPQARHRAVRAELALLASDVPSIPLFFSRGIFAYIPAIYSGWVFIKGTGILDKRSFLPGQAHVATGLEAGVSPNTGDRGSSNAGLSVVNILSLGVLAAVLVLAVAALVQRRSAGRR